MAKPISFTKRDLEKKKQEKRLAKQQKKEERKNSGTSSFEDMIAYVDENGVITDTPPTTNEKPQEIDISTIEVSTPRKTDEPVITEYEGRVEFFNTSKGYGFNQKPEKCREVLFPCKRSARRGNRRKFSDFQTGTRTTRNECRRNQTQEITPTAVYVFTTFLYFSSKR